MIPTVNEDDRFKAMRTRMVAEQIRNRGVHDESVLDAMGSVQRERFLPPELASQAYDDRALAVGCGQTISQPYIVAFMTAALRLIPTDRVLEIGTGTGYQTAVLARLAAHVFSIERIADLHEQARRILAELDVRNVSLVVGDGTLGLPQQAPFDRIIVTAGAPHVPKHLVEQLAPGGVMVAPVGGPQEQYVVRVTRTGNRISEETLLGCRFVKLVGRDGWSEGD